MKNRHSIPVKILAIALGLVFVLCSCNSSFYINNKVFQKNFMSNTPQFDTFREYVDKELYKNDDYTLASIDVYYLYPAWIDCEVYCLLEEESIPIEYSLTPAQEQAISVVPELFAEITKKYDRVNLHLSLKYDGGKLTLAEMYVQDYDAHDDYKGYILEVEQGSMSKAGIDGVSLSDNWYLRELAYPD